ncbi:Mucin-5B [Eumeta japonica]|uniref:Mucin-5B n=1 Tax=Eumeta variegata TaxID=151549 RepID=A0A4C1UKS1_EUMVA|nr:Mucin-5B [Eumeta japonica]
MAFYDKAPSLAVVSNWFNEFKHDRPNLTDDLREGRLSTGTTEDKQYYAAIYSAIYADSHTETHLFTVINVHNYASGYFLRRKSIKRKAVDGRHHTGTASRAAMSRISILYCTFLSALVICASREISDESKTCPPNSQYNECGTACPRTCADKDEQGLCTAQCVRGCYCKPGHILDNSGACVPEESCRNIFAKKTIVIEVAVPEKNRSKCGRVISRDTSLDNACTMCCRPAPSPPNPPTTSSEASARRL